MDERNKSVDQIFEDRKLNAKENELLMDLEMSTLGEHGIRIWIDPTKYSVKVIKAFLRGNLNYAVADKYQ